VVLVDEAAESVAADLARRRAFSSLVGLGRVEFERPMRPLSVVVVEVDAEHAFEVTPVEDQQSVQALGADGPDEAFCDRVGLGCSHGRLDDSDALAAKDLVEGALYLPSRSRIRKRTPWTERSRPRLRARWVTPALPGFFVQPARQTRRLVWTMKKRT
jgi:hypothetical protein